MSDGIKFEFHLNNIKITRLFDGLYRPQVFLKFAGTYDMRATNEDNDIKVWLFE